MSSNLECTDNLLLVCIATRCQDFVFDGHGHLWKLKPRSDDAYDKEGVFGFSTFNKYAILKTVSYLIIETIDNATRVRV
jgi:hypothetical protein